LFAAIGAQIGGENETLRNLLLDANAKIGELDIIKDAVGKLVDPVSKTLRAMEAERPRRSRCRRCSTTPHRLWQAAQRAV
jgi:hypothetical protein